MFEVLMDALLIALILFLITAIAAGSLVMLLLVRMFYRLEQRMWKDILG